jgi:hypothetical protein
MAGHGGSYLSWSRPGHKARPYLENNQCFQGQRCGSSSRALPSKCEALSSNPKNKRRMYQGITENKDLITAMEGLVIWTSAAFLGR